MEISKALEPLDVPVCHPPYSGGSDVFVTFQSMGQTGTLYAEGKEAETASLFSIDLYVHKDTNAEIYIKKIKELLTDEGYICVVNAEMYEKETQRRHYSMTAERVGEFYA